MPLKAHLARLTLAIDEGPAAVIITDIVGRIEYVNRRFTEMSGYEPSEAIGKTPRFLKSGLTPPGVYTELWSTITSGKTWRGELCNRRKDGELFWQSASISPVWYDAREISGYVAVQLDITQTRRTLNALEATEAALRTSEAWYRALMDGTEDMVSVLDAQGYYRYVSASFERTLGYAPSELIGTMAFNLIHPDDLEPVLRTFSTGVQQPGAVRRMQYRLLHKAGHWRSVEGVGRNLLDDPIVAGIVISSRDVTERLTLEAQLRQAQKLEAVGRLVGGVAHDFNNLLTIILGGMEALEEQIPVGDGRRAEIRPIAEAGERAATLVGQLLAFSRQQMVTPVVLDLNLLVADLRVLLGRLVEDDVTVRLQPAAAPALVRADAGQIEQVLLNLVANARDAMPDGGAIEIELEIISVPDETASGHDMPAGRYVRLAVRDNGIGMTEETLTHAFDPFFTTKETGRGTGLGLASVYGIVKQSQGHVWLESIPGRGTTCTICLALENARPDAATPPAPEPWRGGSETILIAEDDAGLRRYVRIALGRLGYRVLESTGEDSIAVAAGFDGPIDLLLTDVVMPGHSGPDLAKTLQESRPGLPVLFMSGYAANHRRAVGISQGSFIQKPFRTRDLAAAVRRALD